MSKIYQIGDLTVISDPLDDMVDNVLKSFFDSYTKHQQEKWKILTNESNESNETVNESWRNVVDNSANRENNLIHSQFNFPSL